MAEKAEISKIETEDEFVDRAKDILDEVKSIDPANLQCLMLCSVSNDGEVKVGILGPDMAIAKMLMTLTSVARNGVIAAQTPSNPSNEATH